MEAIRTVAGDEVLDEVIALGQRPSDMTTKKRSMLRETRSPNTPGRSLACAQPRGTWPRSQVPPTTCC